MPCGNEQFWCKAKSNLAQLQLSTFVREYDDQPDQKKVQENIRKVVGLRRIKMSVKEFDEKGNRMADRLVFLHPLLRENLSPEQWHDFMSLRRTTGKTGTLFINVHSSRSLASFSSSPSRCTRDGGAAQRWSR